MFLINSSPLQQHKTFLDYAIFLVRRWVIPHLCKRSVRDIHIVFDHPERQGISPKQIERFRRDECSLSESLISGTCMISGLEDSAELPNDWRSFLANRGLKRKLVNYLSDAFLSLVPKFLSHGQKFTISGGFDGADEDKAYTCTSCQLYGWLLTHS